MGFARLLPLFALILTLFAPAVHASDVRDLPYRYVYEVANYVSDDAFVICDDCPPRQAVNVSFKQASRSLIAIKMSGPARSAGIRPSEVMTPGTKQSEDITRSSKDQTRRAAEKITLRSELAGIVLFSFGESNLDKLTRGMLDAIANRVPAGSEVSVYGYTCDIGPDNYNQKLSGERADMVAAYLKGKGLKVENVRGLGKTNPISILHRELNRRAEINYTTIKKEDSKL